MKFVVIITTFFSLDTFAQECPPLPKQGFQVEYHQTSINLKDSRLLIGHQFIPHEIDKIDFQKEQELKQYFNRVLCEMHEAKCIPNQALDNRIFLFQTTELLKDSNSFLTQIHNLLKHTPGINKLPVSVVYGGIYQRDVLTGDSIRESNWYIRRFMPDEIREITAQRKKLAFLADSLNREIAKLERNRQDWRITDAQINTLRRQRTPLKAETDSIDFILYPSLLLELKPWYEQQFETAISPFFKPESYLSSAGFGQKGVIIHSDTDPFLKKKFRLHHVFDNNPYFASTISTGDSSILDGQTIYNAKYLRDDYSPWRDGHFSYWSLNEKFLIVFKQESNIGETFWDYKLTYYIYEVVGE